MSFNLPADTFGNLLCGCAVCFDQNRCVFIATITNNDIYITYRVFYQCPKFGQYAASDQMAMNVVYQLERININEKNRQVRGIALNPFNFTFKGNIKIAVIVETADIIDKEEIFGVQKCFGIFKGV